MAIVAICFLSLTDAGAGADPDAEDAVWFVELSLAIKDSSGSFWEDKALACSIISSKSSPPYVSSIKRSKSSLLQARVSVSFTAGYGFFHSVTAG